MGERSEVIKQKTVESVVPDEQENVANRKLDMVLV